MSAFVSIFIPSFRPDNLLQDTTFLKNAGLDESIDRSNFCFGIILFEKDLLSACLSTPPIRCTRFHPMARIASDRAIMSHGEI